MDRLIPAVLFATAGLAHADVSLMSKAQLVRALQEGQPCCVIDGRGEASRKKHPLGDALPYAKDMKIAPTSAVVVVADNDRLAKRIAARLDAAYPGKRIIAVQGGVGVWEAARVAASRADDNKPGIRFVIPRNTCESGTPIQKY